MVHSVRDEFSVHILTRISLPLRCQNQPNFKQKNKKDFGYANQQQNLGKSVPNSQPKGQSKYGQSIDNQSKP